MLRFIFYAQTDEELLKTAENTGIPVEVRDDEMVITIKPEHFLEGLFPVMVERLVLELERRGRNPRALLRTSWQPEQLHAVELHLALGILTGLWDAMNTAVDRAAYKAWQAAREVIG